MLSEWMIGNFKSVATTVNLKLAPLTVLVGANSSGKSTILQSILSVTQTLSSPLSATSHPLVLNGEYLKLGPVRDVLHQGSDTNPLQFGFTLRLDKEHLPRTSGVDEDRNNQALQPVWNIQVYASCIPQSADSEDTLRLVLQNAVIRLDDNVIRIERIVSAKSVNPLPKSSAGDLYQLSTLKFSPSSSVSMRPTRDFQVKANHFLPWELWEQYDTLIDSVHEMLQMCSQVLVGSKDLSSGINALSGVNLDSRIGQEFRDAAVNAFRAAMKRMSQSSAFEIPLKNLHDTGTVGEWLKKTYNLLVPGTRKVLGRELDEERRNIAKRVREKANYKPDHSYRSHPLPEPLNTSRNAIVKYFTEKIRYMGPLRDDPRSVYALPPIPEDSDVGARGEYTAAVLQYHKDDPVLCPTPGDPNLGGVLIPLGEAVTRWLVHMGLVNDVTTYDRGKIGTELTLHVSDLRMPVDLTNVGVGVSQVLPSVVMGLLAPKGSTLLMEQPELHLHPRVQSVLGDFLIGLAQNGRQCIVESHSEYLVNRLRRRIAEAPGDTVQRLIQMYFVERTAAASEFRSVESNEYGAIPSWPRGFFDQGPDEAQHIIQAATKKRQAKLDALKATRKEQ